MKSIIIITSILTLISLNACMIHQNTWIDQEEFHQKRAYPSELIKALDGRSVLALAVKSPGNAYRFDIGEKDAYYDHASGNFIIDSLFIEFTSYLKSNKCLVNLTVKDKARNYFTIPNFDLFRLIHKYDTKGDLLFAETIEEEFNRFGMNFRREHNEFTVSKSSDAEMQKVLNRIIRMNVTNNCLDPNKWEVSLTTEDFSDFGSRRKSNINFSQKRNLSHGWFAMDSAVYNALTNIKNIDKPYDYPSIDYDTATAKAESTYVDFENHRYPVQAIYRPWMLEVGHKSRRILEPVDMEEHYKWEFGIFLNKQQFSNYDNITQTPVELARFSDEGFYNPETPNIYDYGFLKHIDRVELKQLDASHSDTYFEIKLTGDYAPSEITLGNVDLSLLSFTKMRGFLFGFNTYPKGRRYNHSQNTTGFDPETFPDYRLRPYLIMSDREKGTYINNQKKGVEKLYIGYENANRTNLVIYLLSYERITPVWMARVKVPTPVYKTVSAKRNLY